MMKEAYSIDMSHKEFILKIVPTKNKHPRHYQLTPEENAITKSIDNCPLEHSHFIAEQSILPARTIELLLRYAKYFNHKLIEECAKELGLENSGNSWREPFWNKSEWIEGLPPIAKEILVDIKTEFQEWKSKNR